MRSVARMTVVCSLVLLLASAGAAQQQKGKQKGGQFQGGQFGGRGAGMLLTNEGVQKELKLDADQIDKAKVAIQKVMLKNSDSFAKLRDLGQDERREKMQELTKAATEETNKAVAEILKPEQLKRLKQIELQQSGPDAFSTADVQTSLKLTDDQKEKIKLINEDYSKERRSLFQPGGNFQAAGEKMTALRKETFERVASLLTADQKKAWKDLTGEAFEVRFERRRPNNDK